MILQKVKASLMQLHSSSAINVFSGNQTFVLQVHALPFQLQKKRFRVLKEKINVSLHVSFMEYAILECIEISFTLHCNSFSIN